MDTKRRWMVALARWLGVVALLAMAALPLAGVGAVEEDRADDRVIGGRPVADGKYPFLAYIDIPRSGCTGSLIAREWALTAAHCVYDGGDVRPATDFHLILYRADIGNTDQGERVAVTAVKPHPGYDPRTIVNDVALLKLVKPVALENTVRFVGAGPNRTEGDGQVVTIVGWGAFRQTPNVYPDRAREARVEVMGGKKCNMAWDGAITEEMMCAGRLPRTTCSGDSGGPLLVDGRAGWIQIGVTSFGSRKCGELPSVFARLSEPGIGNFIARTIDR